jgi:hypothetical protein
MLSYTDKASIHLFNLIVDKVDNEGLKEKMRKAVTLPWWRDNRDEDTFSTLSELERYVSAKIRSLKYLDFGSGIQTS